jgi:hypothetical protein
MSIIYAIGDHCRFTWGKGEAFLRFAKKRGKILQTAKSSYLKHGV